MLDTGKLHRRQKRSKLERAQVRLRHVTARHVLTGLHILMTVAVVTVDPRSSGEGSARMLSADITTFTCESVVRDEGAANSTLEHVKGDKVSDLAEICCLLASVLPQTIQVGSTRSCHQNVLGQRAWLAMIWVCGAVRRREDGRGFSSPSRCSKHRW